jgi:hypothetical protein
MGGFMGQRVGEGWQTVRENREEMPWWLVMNGLGCELYIEYGRLQESQKSHYLITGFIIFFITACT